jgi:DNA polymerase-3 subunit delta'
MLRQLARLMLCLTPEEDRPCGHCHNCQLSKNGEHPDTLLVGPEEGARDITVDQIRALSEFVHKTSHTGIAKIVVISHAHRMNQSAANALLKTLEEPTKNTFLLLESELPGYLSATIRSRCQRISLAMPDLELSARWLEGYLQEDDDAAALLATVGCRPMRALELAQSGELQERREFDEALSQLVAGKQTPEYAVSVGMKIGAHTAVDAISQFLSTLIYDATNISRDKQRENTNATRQLLTQYEECLVARRQLLSSANPNPQLVLESLLWKLEKRGRSPSLRS